MQHHNNYYLIKFLIIAKKQEKKSKQWKQMNIIDNNHFIDFSENNYIKMTEDVIAQIYRVEWNEELDQLVLEKF